MLYNLLPAWVAKTQIVNYQYFNKILINRDIFLILYQLKKRFIDNNSNYIDTFA